MVVKEGSAHSRTVYFTTDGEAVTPGTVHWSLRCETTGTELIARTSETPGTSLLITIPASANRIIGSANAYETKVITVWTDYGTDSQRTADEHYRVQNLGGVGDPLDDIESDYGG